MQGIYLSNIDPQQSIGYMPKILGQLKGFNQLGYDMNLICFDQDSQIISMRYGKQNKQFLRSKILAKSSSNLFFRRLSLLRETIKHISDIKPVFLYLRYPRSEPLYIYFLAKIRRSFPRLIILSEFPTYPYDKEYVGSIRLKDRLVIFLDRLTRQYLKHFIDKIIAINYEYSIFEIDTISIDNGIKIEDYSPIASVTDSLNPINLIGVANVSPWHGYDRLIKGLGDYYRQYLVSDQRVTFHIVGAQSSCLDELVSLVSAEGITPYVLFHKPSQGKELDLLFEDCHLAVGVLGGHRKGLKVMSPLKNREYCARGIPFFFSHIDPDFLDGFQYCLQIESNETPINIRNLIDFLHQLRNKKNVASRMRDYAQETLDWSIKLEPVRDYINGKLCK